MGTDRQAELSVIGGSNVAGFYGESVPDVILIDVLEQAFLEYKPGIKNLSIVLNLPLNFRTTLVLNEGMPGDTVVEMGARFEEDVVDKNPKRVLIWPGLNDSSLITRLYRGETIQPDRYAEIDPAHAYRLATRGFEPRSAYLERAANFFTNNLEAMVQAATNKGIEVFLGTVPPYSNLDKVEQTPPVEGLRVIGLPTLALINDRIRQTANAHIIDIHCALVDPETNLNRPENAWGDLLHLSNRGQILAGALVASQIFKTNVSVTSPFAPTVRIG